MNVAHDTRHDRITCARKKKYPSYAQAKAAKMEMSERGKAVDLLMVYSCPVATDDHYHLGNPPKDSSLRSRQMKHVEKQRRKALAKQEIEKRSAE